MPTPGQLELTGPQFRPLVQALTQRLDPDELDRMLLFAMNVKRSTYIKDGPLITVATDVVDFCNMRGRVWELVNAAREERPDEAVFVEYAQMLRIGLHGLPDAMTLEVLVQPKNKMLDIAPFRSQMGEVEGRVCRVEVTDGRHGTGFLVGPKHLLTNFHVVEKWAKDEVDADYYACRFDYKMREDGKELNAGRVVRVRRLVAFSPYDPNEWGKEDSPPSPENLDYALIELADEVGAAPINEKSISAPARGWVRMPTKAHVFEEDEPLIMVQHPRGAPLKIALNMNAEIKVNANGTRLRYTTNSEPGSSGSPCFDGAWNLIALHHAGSEREATPWNQGIPIDLVSAHLKARLTDAERRAIEM